MRRLAKCRLTTGGVSSLFFYSDSYTLKQPRRAVVDSFTVKTSLGGRPTRRCTSTTPAESKLLFGTPQLSLAAYGVKSPFYYYKYYTLYKSV